MGGRPGGIELQIPILAANLPETDPQVYLVHGMKYTAESVFTGTGIEPDRGASKLPYSAFRLYRYARRNRDRIFHGFNLGPLFLLVLRLAGIKRIIYSIRGTVYWKKGWQKPVFKLLWRLALSPRVKIISNSDFSADRFRQQVCSKAEITRIYNPIDTDRYYQERTDYPALPQRIIYCGRLVRGKNLQLWVDVAALAASRYPQTEFHLYGDGALRSELEEYAGQKGLAGRITFHGYARNLEKAYKQADLMLFLSEYESFGNVVIESILAGTPVICSDIPSLREIFRNHPGFIVEPGPDTPGAILQKISEYPVLTALTAKAQADFLQVYKVENHIQQLKKVYYGQ